MIMIEPSKVQSVTKYAFDVIKTQIKDHFDQLEEDEDGDFEQLKENLMSALEKNAKTTKATGKETTLSFAAESKASLP